MNKPFSEDYLRNDLFWSEIRSNIDKKKLQIEEQRRIARAKVPKRSCPSCTLPMTVEDMHGVNIDLCQSCGGIFLDRGELDLLFKTKQKSGFIHTLKSFLKVDESL